MPFIAGRGGESNGWNPTLNRKPPRRRTMKLMDFLKEEWLIPSLQGVDKRSILKELSSVLVKPCQVASAEELIQVLLDREKLGSTGIGEGIAIPHGRLKKLNTFLISFGRSKKGVDFDSIDRKDRKSVV